MKYLKTFESKIGFYPNTTDKQYWYYSSEDRNDKGEEIVYLLKFIKYNKEYGGEYFFDIITLTSYDDYEIGDKVPKNNETFSFYESGIKQFQKNGNLRLATPEEIDTYEMYSNTNKYNL